MKNQAQIERKNSRPLTDRQSPVRKIVDMYQHAPRKIAAHYGPSAFIACRFGQKRFSVRAPKKLKYLLVEVAKRQKISVQELVRRMVRERIDSHSWHSIKGGSGQTKKSAPGVRKHDRR